VGGILPVFQDCVDAPESLATKSLIFLAFPALNRPLVRQTAVHRAFAEHSERAFFSMGP
jgi:hypothetical protein